MSGRPEQMTTLACRRSTFETALWRAVSATPGLTRRTGTADRLVVEGGRVTGVVVDGSTLEADLVVDTSGRAGHLGDDLRPPVEGGLCGMSYTSRMYAPRAGATPVDLSFPSGAEHDGYLCIVFPQDADTLSVLIVRDADDADLSLLRHEECYEAAVAAIPHFAPYVDPDRYEPITPAMPGGGLTNTFRGQSDVPGLVAVGDSVSTTNPSAGRGIALGLRQVDELLRQLDEGELDGLGPAMDAWARDAIRPWYEDHVHWDASLRQRWAGADVDVEAPLPSDVICAAAQEDPSMMPVVGPYFGMLIGPRELRAVEEQARAVLRSGWRPPLANGPSRDELVEVISAVRA
jgi:2-polyprenyl-6-methoxyphenol hydroxylase-like FAD-dependent oxidoreductase